MGVCPLLKHPNQKIEPDDIDVSETVMFVLEIKYRQ